VNKEGGGWADVRSKAKDRPSKLLRRNRGGPMSTVGENRGDAEVGREKTELGNAKRLFQQDQGGHQRRIHGGD